MAMSVTISAKKITFAEFDPSFFLSCFAASLALNIGKRKRWRQIFWHKTWRLLTYQLLR
jgi:hypothetical protein